MNGYFKICIALAVLAVYAKAGYISAGGYGGEYGGYGNEIQGGHGGEEEHYDHPKYQFNYAVHDPHTGDVKQHIEERDGDKVKGSYTLKEADGTTRVVEYEADKHNGFNAKVHKIGEPKKEIEAGGGYGGHYGGY